MGNEGVMLLGTQFTLKIYL